MKQDEIKEAMVRLGFTNYIVIGQQYGKAVRSMPFGAPGRVYKQPPLGKIRSSFYIVENGKERLLNDILGDLKHTDSLKALIRLLKDILNQLLPPKTTAKKEKKPWITKTKKSGSKNN